MAFRASKKPSLKKESMKDDVVSDTLVVDQTVAATTPAISVDDFIGAPVDAPESNAASPESPQDIKAFVEAPQAHLPPSQESYDREGGARPRMQSRENRGYQQRKQVSFGGGYQSSGYQPQSGGYRNRYTPQNQGNGYRRPPQGGMRRDFSNAENGFSQDINVPTETVQGILDVMPEGHGFLRPKFTPSDRDVYISQSQIRRFLLRNGDMVEGQARQPKENERYWGLLKVEKINEHLAEEMVNRPKFEDLTPIYPNKLLLLETGQLPLSTRIIDLVAPIGFGQRGLIVSPPKAGKTTIIKELAAGIAENFPNAHLMAALIGERPEEVTDISRSVKGEVLASNFDQSPQEQTRIAEVTLDRAKRLVEMGKDVVVLLDSITRLARAYNMVVNPSGRTLSGGFDPAALYPAKKFLGAARCVEVIDAQGQAQSGGSLTVIGTALVDTGSRMDDLIYEEFKGTGNMELHLSRALQERRIFPAIDIAKSGTRHDELLLGEGKMKKVTTLRHMLSLLKDEERTAMLIDKLSKNKTNDEFLESLAKGD
jgi:transcription termination factor Rho